MAGMTKLQLRLTRDDAELLARVLHDWLSEGFSVSAAPRVEQMEYHLRYRISRLWGSAPMTLTVTDGPNTDESVTALAHGIKHAKP